MSISRIVSKSLPIAAATFFATTVLAHPKLLSSSPADKSEGSAPAKIELKFSEKLTAQFSSANLIMTGMPGHGAMKVNASVSGGGDDKAMVITPVSPLATGTYRLEWRAVSSDTHPVNGSLSFLVK